MEDGKILRCGIEVKRTVADTPKVVCLKGK